MIIEQIQKKLFESKDETFKNFHANLIPTSNRDKVIGVKTPFIKAIAKKFENHDDVALFLSSLPHEYYEENQVHAFLINRIKDFKKAISLINQFLPYIDNWATCDALRPKAFKKNSKNLLAQIKIWLKSPHEYTVRFALEMLMVHFLEDNFSKEILELAVGVKREEYYIQMMQAWFVATLLVKQPLEGFKVIKEKRLSSWVHNKSIQKACESFRVSKEDKLILKKMKV